MSDKEVIHDIITRGVENIIPSKEALVKKLSGDDKLNVYFGIDPTAPKIHIGHAFNLRKLQKLVELGHNVKFLVGDFTALVGDTSDKNDERPQLTEEEINTNVEGYKRQAQKFLDFDSIGEVRNSSWLKKLTFNDIMKLMRHFSINDFTSRELIRGRLDEGKRVGLVETIYPLMQGYDSYFMDTDLQLGATDQTFNMQSGRKLQKALRDKESFVLSSGYLPGTDGRKMSKSWGNAIWVDDAPEDVFGKVMSISDDVVNDYFIFATNLSVDEIEKHMAIFSSEPMETKRALARHITSEIHGIEVVEVAERHFQSTVVDKVADDDAPEINFSKGTSEELGLVLVLAGLVESNSQVRRLLEQGAIRVNGEKIQAGDKLDLKSADEVRVGKRRFARIK